MLRGYLILTCLCLGRLLLCQIIPRLAQEPKILGVVTDPQLNRDSCASVLFGARAFWTCRDTQTYEPDGVLNISVVSSSASWTNFTANGFPALEPESGGVSNGIDVLSMYGKLESIPFFPYAENECMNSSAGECNDGSRYAIWPDSPPVVTYNDSVSVAAYSWIKQAHIEGLVALVSEPAVTLYRLNWFSNMDIDQLPVVTIVEESFWSAGELDYGVYGALVHLGTAYLYAHASNGVIALARVASDSIEDRSCYEYWANGAWQTEQPCINSTGINITDVTAGGQGTFYWSEAWCSFVWIGQANNSVFADFFITTAPEPQGPWIEPILFWSGVNGNSSLPSYSLQAQPALTQPGANEMYLTYTINDLDIDGVNIYTTPLIYVEWE